MFLESRKRKPRGGGCGEEVKERGKQERERAAKGKISPRETTSTDTKELDGNAAEKIGNFRKIKRIESNYVEPMTSAL